MTCGARTLTMAQNRIPRPCQHSRRPGSPPSRTDAHVVAFSAPTSRVGSSTAKDHTRHPKAKRPDATAGHDASTDPPIDGRTGATGSCGAGHKGLASPSMLLAVCTSLTTQTPRCSYTSHIYKSSLPTSGRAACFCPSPQPRPSLLGNAESGSPPRPLALHLATSLLLIHNALPLRSSQARHRRSCRTPNRYASTAISLNRRPTMSLSRLPVTRTNRLARNPPSRLPWCRPGSCSRGIPVAAQAWLRSGTSRPSPRRLRDA